MKTKIVVIIFTILMGISFGAEQQFAFIGNLKLENGQVLKDCRIGYRVIGKMNSDKSNVLIYPTWFGGTSENVSGLVSKDKLVDPEGFCFIIIDAIGNGVSTSPSNSKKQPPGKFPVVTIRDMVQAEYIMLTRELGIQHLYGAVGGSMGSFQIFEWLVQYPDFIDRAVLYVCSPRLTSYDLLEKEIQLEIIETGRKYNIPDMELSKILNMYTDHTARSPQHMVQHVSRDEYFKKLDSYAGLSETFTIDNKACQLKSLISHDITRDYHNSLQEAAAQIKTELLLIVSETDHIVNPQPARDIAPFLNCQFMELHNDGGHLAIGPEMDRVAAEINQFLRKPLK